MTCLYAFYFSLPLPLPPYWSFVFMLQYYSMLTKKGTCVMKVICQGPDERLVGLHIFGMGADEMLQGFAVGVTLGITKAQLDKCIAIHPTASEELVLLR